MKKIDLHIHTHFSDGLHSVEEVFELAQKAGIQTIAIADRNWPYHIQNNSEIAKRFELEYIQGIEISSLFEDKTIHILGYSKNFNLNKLCRGLEKQITGFDTRSKKIAENINASGEAKISYSELRKKYKGCIQNFPVMIELGRALNARPLSETTKKIYNKFKLPYGDWFLTPPEVIKLIHQSNGIAILAHPAVTWKKIGRKSFNKLLPLLVDAGLDGFEANHSEQSRAEENVIIKLAQKNNLLVTGGSDFHGLKIHPDRILGKSGMEPEQLKKLLEKLAR